MLPSSFSPLWSSSLLVSLIFLSLLSSFRLPSIRSCHTARWSLNSFSLSFAHHYSIKCNLHAFIISLPSLPPFYHPLLGPTFATAVCNALCANTAILKMSVCWNVERKEGRVGRRGGGRVKKGRREEGREEREGWWETESQMIRDKREIAQNKVDKKRDRPQEREGA